MARTGPIIVIEDDLDDQQILEETLREIGVENEIKFFTAGEELIPYLRVTTDKPFLIISDVNIPGVDGTELRRKINADDQLRKKAIPYIFYTTTAKKEAIEAAYEMMVQGYFEKSNTAEEAKRSLKVMIDYWNLCKHPNSE